MARGVPVIAINSGGPTESIKHDLTGYLLDQSAEIWAKHIELVKTSPDLREKLGSFAKTYVSQEFSLNSMSQKLFFHLSNLNS